MKSWIKLAHIHPSQKSGKENKSGNGMQMHAAEMQTNRIWTERRERSKQLAQEKNHHGGQKERNYKRALLEVRRSRPTSREKNDKTEWTDWGMVKSRSSFTP